ncbi:hypothetical protein LCGC14_1610400 [marine sediment metagenome]|uniref:DUF3987 domain-containing protein n=1 Tax=marine sediment metagenome TaxID=412755 RepID=A0A0F9L8Q2_9ZZZZ
MAFDYDLNRVGWFGAAQDFASILMPASNYPASYVYAMFMALSGHLIGRNAYLRYPTRLYPNHYICLVGPSALTHKSTAITLAIESLGGLEDDIQTMRSLTTVQGLLISMGEGMGSTLVVLDEIATMLQKKNVDYASDLISRIVELYACPSSAGTFTRHDPIRVTDTFLTIVSGSTTEWLQSTLSPNDLLAGFGNRMTFVLGDPRPEKSWPGTPKWMNLDWERLMEFEGECRLDEDARDIWEVFYKKFTRQQKKSTPFTRTLAERVPEKILKASIVMGAWYRDTIISGEILAQAIDWGEYLHECIERLTPTFDAPERRVLQLVRLRRTVRRDTIFEELSHDMSVNRIRECLVNLKWLGYTTEHRNEISIVEDE